MSATKTPEKPKPIVPAGSYIFARNDFYEMALKFSPAWAPRGLAHASGAWWVARKDGRWDRLDESELIAGVYTWGARQFVPAGDDGFRKMPMNQNVVTNIIHALQAAHTIKGDPTCPGVPLADGWMDMVTREVKPYELEFFVSDTLPFASGQVDAHSPELWLNFLGQGFSAKDISLLQEWFGYCLVPGNKYHRILWLYGSRGCGKSLITNILIEMLGGVPRIAVRKADDFRSNFAGDLLGKRLIYFQDYRHAGARDAPALNFVLTVSTNDPVKIEQKYKEGFTARLPGKIVFSSNEMPSFKDNTGAMMRRLLIMHRKSRVGPPDPDLEGKLMAELPRILGWALDGLKRLTERGDFDAGMLDQKLIDNALRGTAPVVAWAKDFLKFEEDGSARKFDLFTSWTLYADGRGHHKSFSQESLMGPLFQAAEELGYRLSSDPSGRKVLGVRILKMEERE